MKKLIDVAAGTITFTFDGLDPVVFTVNKASVENNDYAVFNGYSHRIGDSAAVSRKLPDGTIQTITEAMRREAVLATVEHFESGTKEWDMRAKPAAQNPAIAALAAKLGKTYAEAQAYIAEKAMAELMAG